MNRSSYPICVARAEERLPLPVVRNAEPFVKWAGGKRQLLDQIQPSIPTAFKRYYEPFVGGGALFFHLAPVRLALGQAALNDANARLVRTYRAVRDHVEDVIALLGTYVYEEDFFYETRKRDIDAPANSDFEVAAWFLYMNRTCYNGMYRVNKAGHFNVPFGRYTNPTICDAPNLRACSASLHRTDLTSVDFQVAVEPASAGDWVYFDPPYLPLSVTSDFTKYTADGFGLEDHRRLRDTAVRLHSRGVKVLLSHSAAPVIYDLYKAPMFTIREVLAARSVNSKVANRGKIKELLIQTYQATS